MKQGMYTMNDRVKFKTILKHFIFALYIMMVMIAGSAAHATDMYDVIRLCQAELNNPKQELMYKACVEIMKSIKMNETKNQFSCECQWNTRMEVVQNGKLCQYNCQCQCLNNGPSFSFDSVKALSQEIEPNSDHGYICQGQSLWAASSDVPVWKRMLIGNPFKIQTGPTTIPSDLTSKIDERIKCNDK